jgi:GAF domain-containing protein
MNIEKVDKKKLLSNIEYLIDKNVPLVSNLSNISRLLMDSFDKTLWCGFYLTDDSGEVLYLGPYQGPLACTLIPFGKGVCGTSAKNKKTIIVPNVHNFPGHIACSSLSNSEIVVPILKNEKVVAIIDMDSALFNNYTEDDQSLLEEVAKLIGELF